MGIKKEKTIIILELIFLSSIILTTSLIQLSEHQLQKHQENIQLKLLYLSGYREVINFWHTEVIKLNIHQISDSMGAEFQPISDDKINNMPDNNLKNLMLDVNANKISRQEYLSKSHGFIDQKILGLQATYNIEQGETETLIQNKPKIFNIEWDLIRRVSYFIQIVSIIISAILYLLLFKTIGKKYLTGIENKYQKLIEDNRNLKNKINQLKNK